MTLKTRRIFLLLAIVFFLLVTPTLVLYACGYSLDWSAKKIVLTGGFRLKTIPSKADIIIDDHRKGQTPKGITRLIPKEYTVKIEKEGYQAWQKKLKIEAEKVTEAVNILLVPTVLTAQTLLTDLSADFNIADYLLSKNPEPNHFLTNFPDQSAGYTIVDNNLYYIEKPSYLLLKNDLTNTNKTVLYDQALTSGLDYRLYFLGDHLLLLSSDSKLYLFDIQNKILNKISDDVLSLQACSDNKKFLYYNENEIWVYYLTKKEIQPYQEANTKELITRISKPISSAIWYPQTNEHIIYAAGEQLKIIELDFRDIRNNYNLLDAETSQMYYDGQTQRLYFTENNSLNSLALDKK